MSGAWCYTPNHVIYLHLHPLASNTLLPEWEGNNQLNLNRRMLYLLDFTWFPWLFLHSSSLIFFTGFLTLAVWVTYPCRCFQGITSYSPVSQPWTHSLLWPGCIHVFWPRKAHGFTSSMLSFSVSVSLSLPLSLWILLWYLLVFRIPRPQYSISGLLQHNGIGEWENLSPLIYICWYIL